MRIWEKEVEGNSSCRGSFVISWRRKWNVSVSECVEKMDDCPWRMLGE